MPESRSLSELTRQIAPPTKNGHAPPPTESRKSSQSVNHSCVRAGQVVPCWVKLSRRLHTWWCPSVNFFKFQLCNHTPPGLQKLWFPGSCRTGQKQSCPIASLNRLRKQLQRYLIVFEPASFALDQWKRSRETPSHPSVWEGSKNFTFHPLVRITPSVPIYHYVST